MTKQPDGLLVTGGKKATKTMTTKNTAYKPQIGDRVKFNDRVAFAFVGKTGEIIETRNSVINGHLWVVKLDEPTPAAKNWSPIETLAVSSGDIDPLNQSLI